MQVINTSGYGDLTFIRTWSDGTIHIGKLKDGGYCHIGGPPVASKRDLESAIPSGTHLDEALDWWENKDKIEEKKDRPKIVIQGDGSYAFDDGSPIESVADFVAYIPQGPALDAAVLWYVETHRDKIEQNKSNATDTAQQTTANKEEIARLTCVCGFVAKRVITNNGSLNMTGLIAHKRVCKVYQANIAKAA